MAAETMMPNATPARKMEGSLDLNQPRMGEALTEPVHTRRLKEAEKANKAKNN